MMGKTNNKPKIASSENANFTRSIIQTYFSDSKNRIDSSIINKRFVDNYIRNECATENVHEREEILGLEVMYEEMIELPSSEVSLFIMGALNRDLYSKCPFPKQRGEEWRTSDAHLEGRPVDLMPHTQIFDALVSYEPVVENIKELAHYMRETQDYSRVFEYINSCVVLNSALLKIHPFEDGNGRTIRCFTNRLFIEAGIPPVYIRPDEKQNYMKALELSQEKNDHRELNEFYLYKICDSIIELDFNNRINKDFNIESNNVKKKKKK